MKRYLTLLLTVLTLLLTVSSCKTTSGLSSAGGKDDKHEFRGAWIQTAYQDQRYASKTPEQCQAYLRQLVETLYETGFNAIIFQVRPEGDAFYKSELEPWSRFLTGAQGRAPKADWDPMAYMIELCHNHGMEFHAWINPYRMYASKTWNLASGHLYYQHPDWFVKYDDRLYLNPGLPESRAWIRDVVKDIVARYDVDAIHMDDYFYPYPVAGQSFNDINAFQTYGPVMGFDTNQLSDLYNFRRRSVSILIKSVHDDIQQLKPWVRFGISPFGIYRNQKSWSGGSATNGTQCYDDLFADVLLWAQSGWVDYLMPQLYWEIGHTAADYKTLCDWWARSMPEGCQLYIGQSIERSLDKSSAGTLINDVTLSHSHLDNKLKQAAASKHIQGNCYWYAYEVEDNTYHVRDYLQKSVFGGRVLPPLYAGSKKKPSAVSKLDGDLVHTKQGTALHLQWQAARPADDTHPIRFYNVYRFAKGEKVNTKNMKHLCAQVCTAEYFDYTATASPSYTYVVTAVDSSNREGKAVKASFKLR